MKISVPRAFHVKKNCSPATYNYTASPCARTCWNSLRSVSMRQVPADFQTTFTRKRRGAKLSALMPLMKYKKLILLSPSPQDPPPVHIPTQVFEKFFRKFKVPPFRCARSHAHRTPHEGERAWRSFSFHFGTPYGDCVERGNKSNSTLNFVMSPGVLDRC